ncbi:MAG: type II toxin-antitoxin system HicA family toxin [Deltaproteobacteria bacterium]|nr:type II toxin-antitoxin system HicA family toxin [Deltaproteobacteria bacterium]
MISAVPLPLQFLGDGFAMETPFMAGGGLSLVPPKEMETLLAGSLWMTAESQPALQSRFEGASAQNQKFEKRMLGPAGNTGQLFEDRILRKVELFLMKWSDEAIDASICFALLEFKKEGKTVVDRHYLLLYLLNSLHLSSLLVKRMMGRIEALDRKGILSATSLSPMRIFIRLMDEKKAGEQVFQFKFRQKKTAEAIGMVTNGGGTKRETERFQALMKRHEALIVNTEALGRSQNAAVAREAQALLANLQKRSTFSLAKLEKAEERLFSLQRMEQAPASLQTIASAPPRPLEVQETGEEDRLLRGEELEIYLKVLAGRIAELKGDPKCEKPHTRIAIEAVRRRWLEKPEVRIGQIERYIARVEESLRDQRRRQIQRPPVSVAGTVDVSRASKKIDWSRFPRTLSFVEAQRILALNGFELLRINGSHHYYRHVGHPGINTILSKSYGFLKEKRRLSYLKKALRAITDLGEEIRW